MEETITITRKDFADKLRVALAGFDAIQSMNRDMRMGRTLGEMIDSVIDTCTQLAFPPTKIG